MATIPCTIVFRSASTELPVEAVFVIVKHLFRYGVKSLETKGDQIFLKLAYTPRTDTMRRKLGNLPIVFVRFAVDSEEEWNILKSCMQKYSFDWSPLEYEDTGMSTLPQPPRPVSSTSMKRKNEDELTKMKKVRILEDRILAPPSSVLREVYDSDADEFEGQKYSVLELQ